MKTPKFFFGAIVVWIYLVFFEWLLHGEETEGRAASTQMWLLFVAGIVINIGFISH